MNDRFICVDASDVVVKLIKGNVPEAGLVLVPMIERLHDQVAPGDVRQPDGSFAKPVIVPSIESPAPETVADLLAQIEALKAKVEALDPAVSP